MEYGDHKRARARRNLALKRTELRGASAPRQASAGVTSMAQKVVDEESRRAIEAFMAKRQQTRGAPS